LADDVLRIIGSMAGPTFHMLSKKCHKALQKKQLLGRQMGDMLIGGAKKGFSEAEMQRALKTRG
jgi:hypothetical protein